jgi:hypothetical protein
MSGMFSSGDAFNNDITGWTPSSILFEDDLRRVEDMFANAIAWNNDFERVACPCLVGIAAHPRSGGGGVRGYDAKDQSRRLHRCSRRLQRHCHGGFRVEDGGWRVDTQVTMETCLVCRCVVFV